MTDSDKKEPGWREIGRGAGGWHANRHNCSSTGGSLEGYLKDAEEGCLVYDGKGANLAKWVHLVVSGPMVGHNLPPGTVDRFSDKDREAARTMLPGLSGGFEKLALAAQHPKFTGLDQVALDVYEGLLRQVPGVRIGHVVGGQVVWENESEVGK